MDSLSRCTYKLNFNRFSKIYIFKDTLASCQLTFEATVRSPLLESDAGSSSYVMVLEVCDKMQDIEILSNSFSF